MHTMSRQKLVKYSFKHKSHETEQVFHHIPKYCIVHDLFRNAKTVGHTYGEDTPVHTEINPTNFVRVAPAGLINTMTSISNRDDNSIAEAKKGTRGVRACVDFSNSFKMEYRTNSFTILRIKASR